MISADKFGRYISLEELDDLDSWNNRNGMKFNNTNCKSMLFCANNKNVYYMLGSNQLEARGGRKPKCIS